jgi:putative ABC transport system permease protein
VRHLSILDRKLLRDLKRLWAQALAIALVISAGVATFILALGSYRSLDETRAAYYERHRFADVFATVKRAPRLLEPRIAAIPGVLAAETRIVKLALLDLEGFAQPATAQVLSIPDHRSQRLNVLYLRAGRLPEPDRLGEVAVSEAFATAHGFGIGSRFHGLLNGKRYQLTIVGIALSPEFIYAIGPGDLIPDDRRFAILWMSEKALAGIFDLEGAFNSVSLQLQPGASVPAVIAELDALLARYGSTGAEPRKDQLSHAFLDAELEQLRAMASVIPPIFLFVSAFLINMTLARLIALEREQIGLLKAVGYGRGAVVGHYLKLVLAIAAIGILIGFGLGTWLGQALAQLYARFYRFPFLLFERDLDIYLVSAVLSGLAAVLGAVRAVLTALRLPPAVAMQAPAPARYRALAVERTALFRRLSQLTLMSLRHLVRWPLRSAFTVLGLALSGALIVVSLFSIDSVEYMIDAQFGVSQRQHATITFTDARGARALQAVERLPGILGAEPYRSVVVRLKNGHLERKLAILGRPEAPDLSRVVDRSQHPLTMPRSGIMLDEYVARTLGLRRGDLVEVEILEGRRGTRWVPVVGIIEAWIGTSAYMHIEALNALAGEGPSVSGAHVAYDAAAERLLFAAIKATPAIAAIALQRLSLVKFRETLAANINTMVAIYLSLAVIVAFGVVYNSARIQLSEHARDLASLRVLGFTRGEVSRVLLLELAILVLLAQPLCWLLGWLFGWLVIQSFSSDIYRAPLIVSSATYAIASLVVMASAAVAGFIVRRRVDRLDLIEVLKTRD